MGEYPLVLSAGSGSQEIILNKNLQLPIRVVDS
jgi:hypothetical protein